MLNVFKKITLIILIKFIIKLILIISITNNTSHLKINNKININITLPASLVVLKPLLLLQLATVLVFAGRRSEGGFFFFIAGLSLMGSHLGSSGQSGRGNQQFLLDHCILTFGINN